MSCHVIRAKQDKSSAACDNTAYKEKEKWTKAKHVHNVLANTAASRLTVLFLSVLFLTALFVYGGGGGGESATLLLFPTRE